MFVGLNGNFVSFLLMNFTGFPVVKSYESKLKSTFYVMGFHKKLIFYVTIFHSNSVYKNN
jgi:hypothetical protein